MNKNYNIINTRNLCPIKKVNTYYGVLLFRITKVTSVSNVTLYAHWMETYATFTGINNATNTYIANGSSYLIAYYDTYYWQNNTGRTLTVSITVKSCRIDESTGSAAYGIVYKTPSVSSSQPSSSYEVISAAGNSSGSFSTKSITISIESGYYLELFNQSNSLTYYTVQLLP